MLNILISTIDQGIQKIANVLLPYREDVSYIVSHQYTVEIYKIIPEELFRKDITISQIPGFGVTKSRNNAIRLANGDIGLFSDDDVTYTNEYFDTILNYFSDNISLDVAIFKIKTPDGYPEYKKYPNKPLKIKKLPFSVGTIEIAFNIKRIQDSNIRFDERFGAGQPKLIGSDESIFIHDCIYAGLNVWYHPSYIVSHPYESTIKKIPKYDIRRVCVTGAYDARINGIISIPKSVAGTIKFLPDLLRHKKNPLAYLIERLSGALYILKTNKNQ